MKHSGIAIGIVAIGAGLTTIGLNMNGGGRAAHANAPMVQAGGPTIVWYGTTSQANLGSGSGDAMVLRAWSDGTVEGRSVRLSHTGTDGCAVSPSYCFADWFVIASPNQGLAAASDSNFDERVDAEDLARLLTNWGDAPRSQVPPSDCPLALINP